MTTTKKRTTMSTIRSHHRDDDDDNNNNNNDDDNNKNCDRNNRQRKVVRHDEVVVVAVAPYNNNDTHHHHHHHHPLINDVSSETTTPTTTVVSKTRICIKNVPPKLQNETDLRQFLLQRLSSVVSSGTSNKPMTITDCRIIQPSSSSSSSSFKRNKKPKNSNSRPTTTTTTGCYCMAFIGFACADHAQWAVQQLHRTYYQTTQLHVEMARRLLPSLSSLSLSSSTTTNNNNNNKSSCKPPPIRIDSKKRAFLAAMGITVPPETTTTTTAEIDVRTDHHDTTLASRNITTNDTHRPFWANDDTDMIATTTTATATATAVDDDNDDVVSDGNDDADEINANDDDDDDEINDDDDNDDADPLLQTKIPSSKKSAMDFLRSKQVNVSDLPAGETNDDDGDDNGDNDTSQIRIGTIVNDPNVRVTTTAATTTTTTTTTDTTSTSCTSAIIDHRNHHIDVSEESVVVVKESDTSSSNEINDVDDEYDDANNDNNEDSSTTNIDPNRLFLRNLPFIITEVELRHRFEPYGTIVECHIAIDDQYRNKGYAFISYSTAASAYTARVSCDQHDFHGRLLHILPAERNSKIAVTSSSSSSSSAINNDNNNNNINNKTKTYKESREDKRRVNAIDDQSGWMSSHVRDDAVLDNLAVRLGIRKGDLFNVKDTLRSGDAAVRLALGETAIIDENRNYFRQHGIDMETLVSCNQEQPRGTNDDDVASSKSTTRKIERSTTSILVKNLPFDTTHDDLKQIFIGNDIQILLPPSRTIAVIEYKHPNDAKLAFRKLAYRRFKNVPLYLEWAPLASKSTVDAVSNNNDEDNTSRSIPADFQKVVDSDDEESNIAAGPTATLYIKNLNFSTTEEQLRNFFLQYDPNVLTVRIPKKVVTVKHDRVHNNNIMDERQQQQSMGFGFVELSSKASTKAILKKVQGAVLDDHALQLHISASGSTHDQSQHPKNTISAPKGNNDNKKLIVRNVPFQATRKELLQLFGSFGTLKNVRLPKKFDGSHRGFAFVEYLTAKECVHAMNTLSKTHLYGRHLVLEWAEKDAVVDDLEFLRSKAERDMVTSISATTATPRSKKIRFD